MRLPIEPGQRGYRVKVLQRFLFARGRTCPEILRGFYGRKTIKGVKELQAIYKREQTGIFDDSLVQAMLADGIDYAAWCKSMPRRLAAVRVSRARADESSPETLRRVQEEFMRMQIGLLNPPDPADKHNKLIIAQGTSGRFASFRHKPNGNGGDWVCVGELGQEAAKYVEILLIQRKAERQDKGIPGLGGWRIVTPI